MSIDFEISSQILFQCIFTSIKEVMELAGIGILHLAIYWAFAEVCAQRVLLLFSNFF